MEWRAHPVHANYQADRLGRIKGPTQIVSYGGVKDDGYVYKRVNKTKTCSSHRLIWEAFNGVIPAGMQVDHVNGKKADNRLENLQLMTPSQHAAKTRLDNPGMIMGAVRHKMTKVQRICGREVVVFESQREAARQTPGAWQSLISKCLVGVLATHAGYVWRAVASTPDKEGVYWASLWQPRWKGLQVSNSGLVKGRNDAPFSGTLIGDYRVVRFQGKAYKVHRLVCMAFNGRPTTDSLTVDHIDRNTQNNCADNLRWATGKEQAANKRKRV